MNKVQIEMFFMSNEALTKILPPGEGRRGSCAEDSVAGRRLVAVILVPLIHVIILARG